MTKQLVVKHSWSTNSGPFFTIEYVDNYKDLIGQSFFENSQQYEILDAEQSKVIYGYGSDKKEQNPDIWLKCKYL